MKNQSVLPNSQRRLLLLSGLLALGGVSSVQRFCRGDDMSKMHDHHMAGMEDHDPHTPGRKATSTITRACRRDQAH